MHREKGNSLMEGYVSELWDFTHISITQNNLQEMKEIWDQQDDETNQLFYCHYVDLVPTVEEYTTLLLCLKIQADKAYSRAVNVPTFLKKLTSITRIREQWVIAWIDYLGISIHEEKLMNLTKEFQKNVMSQLTQLLAGGLEKGKSPMVNAGDDNEDPAYPS
ncbi:hypothetical protein Goari_004423, partial [Gossypium aridum]|nr:hypothetical protein [Gossypium aridum]